MYRCMHIRCKPLRNFSHAALLYFTCANHMNMPFTLMLFLNCSFNFPYFRIFRTLMVSAHMCYYNCSLFKIQKLFSAEMPMPGIIVSHLDFVWNEPVICSGNLIFTLTLYCSVWLLFYNENLSNQKVFAVSFMDMLADLHERICFDCCTEWSAYLPCKELDEAADACCNEYKCSM